MSIESNGIGNYQWGNTGINTGFGRTGASKVRIELVLLKSKLIVYILQLRGIEVWFRY